MTLLIIWLYSMGVDRQTSTHRYTHICKHTDYAHKHTNTHIYIHINTDTHPYTNTHITHMQVT